MSISEYDPPNQTVTVGAGMPLAELQASLEANRQWLPIRPFLGKGGTVGGLIALGACGPERLRYGAARDLLLGLRFVSGKGKLVSTGGRVVKNVAGFAIHRLLCGSRGALALLIEASLKLGPAPQARAALLYAATPEQIVEVRRWSPFPRLEPAFLTVVAGEPARRAAPTLAQAPLLVIIGFEEDAPLVERQIARTREVLGSPAAELRGPEVAALGHVLTDLPSRAGPHLAFASAHNTPAALTPLIESLAAADLVFHAPAGRLHLFPAVTQAQEWVHRLAGPGFTLIEASEVGRLEPAIPPQVAAIQLRERVREALDPGRIFAMGDPWVNRGA